MRDNDFKNGTKRKLSGEIFKEKEIDILQTSLEQIAFCSKSHKTTDSQLYKLTLWKKLRNGPNRRLPYFTKTKNSLASCFSNVTRKFSMPYLSASTSTNRKFVRRFVRSERVQSFANKSTCLCTCSRSFASPKNKNTSFSFTIKIGDYLSSGDQIGEKSISVLRTPAYDYKSPCKANKSPCKALLCTCTQVQSKANKANSRIFSPLSLAHTKGVPLANAITFLRLLLACKASCKAKLCTCSLRFLLYAHAHAHALRARARARAGARARARAWARTRVRARASDDARRTWASPFFPRGGAKGDVIPTPKLWASAYQRQEHERCRGSVKEVRTSTFCPFHYPCPKKGAGMGTLSFVKDARQPIILSSSGRVLAISKSILILQKTQPVLFYNSASLHVKRGEWVSQGSPILTLTHQTLITGDIVQGIPRIEQLFEAFTSPPPAFKDKRGFTKFKDVHDTLHSQVRDIFRKYWLKNVLPIAVRKSLEEIGYILVEMIQKVYLSQGVLIADKHIEIIIRQIASKGQILDSGSTGLFLEEILPIQQIENANLTTPGKKCLYVPAVMGLTAAALNSDSFISAASFQETTRVLSRDAVVGKSDFLRGLKEKVVIGDLISAGTGLDIYFIYNTMTIAESEGE